MLHRRFLAKTLTLATLALALLIPSGASALTPIPPPGPQSSSTGLQGEISSAPPKSAPTISTPSNGQVFSNIPITVSGLCSAQTVKIFDSNVFVGAAQCQRGSYTLQVDLFNGQNDLVAYDYDALEQQSPASNTVTVTFNDAQFVQFGTRVTLTSPYARKGANPGDTLTWPIIINGGVGPYAISVDWGDSTSPSLQSAASTGQINIQHVYQTAGTYSVIVRATDKNGTVAFLQLIGVANGKVTAAASAQATSPPKTVTQVLWWPLAVLFVLLVVAFFLGRKQQLEAIRRQLEKSRAE